MTQAPTSVIYLPPGVIPAASGPPPVPGTGIPFDRAFFERLLPQAVQVFCNNVECNTPRVEIYTLDGSTHYVNGISGVTDTFVALQTSREEHEHPMQVFIPYQTIFRVEIHPESDNGRRKLGFTLGAKVPPAIQPAAAAQPQPKAKGKARTAQPS